MFKRYLISSAAVTMCAGALAFAQAPATTNPANPAGQERWTARESQPQITLTGCLQRERDVPGRSPNVAERAGVLEDYILTGASAAAPAGAGAASTPGAAHGADRPSATAGHSSSATAGQPDTATAGHSAGTTTAGQPESTTAGNTASSSSAGRTETTTADHSASSAQTGASTTAGTTGAATTAGTTGAAAMNQSLPTGSQYKIEGIDDERLQAMVGKRVEVIGRIDADDMREVAGTSGSATATAGAPAHDDDMPEFEAMSIRAVGDCNPAAAR